MRRLLERVFSIGIVICGLFSGRGAWAETEYDMFRSSPTPLQAVIAPGVPQTTDCAFADANPHVPSALQPSPDDGAHIGAIVPMLDNNGDSRVVTSQFQPSPLRHWRGNLKRYGINIDPHKTDGSAVVTSEDSGTLVAAPCHDGAQMCLSTSARSAWTSSVRPDGNIVTRGGAADQLPKVNKRKILLQSGSTLVPLRHKSSINALTHDEHLIVERIARQHGWEGASLPADAEDTAVVSALQAFNRLAGMDANNEEYAWLKQKDQHPLQHHDNEVSWMGASVFGAPVQVNYASTENDSNDVIWWSSSDGFLRAIDANSGETLVAILPEAVINVVTEAKTLELGDVIPGLDTGWVALRHDHNHDGKIVRADGDYLYLYGGMRRGGTHIYAWDVTEPALPTLLFDLSPDVAGFSALAYTWSTPSIANIWLPGYSKPEAVLVFGGGYDNRLDGEADPIPLACKKQSSRCGAAIYFVKATGRDAGRLLWSVGGSNGSLNNTQMQALIYPIAAPIKALDVEGDGIADFFYALDLQGQVFRLQMPGDANSSLAVALVADLREQTDTSVDNAFFFAPSVAVMQVSSGVYAVALATGSGAIPQPFGSLKRGRLFVLNDILSADMSTDAAPTTPSSNDARWLESTSDHRSATSRLFILPSLATGEKLASAPTIADGKAFFSTFVPSDVKQAGCQSLPGRQRIWAVDIQTGKPVLDAVGDISANDPKRYVVEVGVMSGGSQLSPLLIKNQFSILSGVSAVATTELSAPPQKLRWRQLRTGPGVKAF